MTSYIIIAFFIGSTVGCVLAMFLFGCFHSRQREDWQAEYRRLMAGIKKAWLDTDKPNIPHSFIANDLRKLYYDEPNWPRK